MFVLDYKKGDGKTNNKTKLFCHPLLEGEKVKKERGQRSKNTTIFTLFFGAFKAGRKQFHLFEPPNFTLIC